MISDILDERPACKNETSQSSNANTNSSSVMEVAGSINHAALPAVQFTYHELLLDERGDECSPTDSGLGDCKERAESPPTVDTNSPPSSQNSDTSKPLKITLHISSTRVHTTVYI